MIELAPERIAAACGAEIIARGPDGRPERAAVDTRALEAGDLFFGIPGSRDDGGAHAEAALAAGAWGVVVTPPWAERLAAGAGEAWVLSAPDPLAALQGLARAWHQELGVPVIGITGSTGKTTVKDMTRALLPMRAHATTENLNTEIGLPLTILAAPPESEALVLEMAMRGGGQIAELCEIAEPDVAAITNIGPVHLELLGSIDAIARAKAEILQGMRDGGTAVVPADEEALTPHLADNLATITVGPGGDVFARSWDRSGETITAEVVTPAGTQAFTFPFAEEYNLHNALTAIAIGVALGVEPARMAPLAGDITFSRLRGELIELPRGVVLVNDCYNANPISMRAALDHLAASEADGKRIAVLGGMAELGPNAPALHDEAGAHARDLRIGTIVGVGELARDYAPDHWAPDAQAAVPIVEELIEPGDRLLVKGSRSVGLEAFTDELIARLR